MLNTDLLIKSYELLFVEYVLILSIGSYCINTAINTLRTNSNNSRTKPKMKNLENPEYENVPAHILQLSSLRMTIMSHLRGSSTIPGG